MPEARLSVGHGKYSIKMLEGCRNLGTSCVVMLKHRDVDQFKVLAVSTAMPYTFQQLNTVPTTTGETGIGNVLVCPVTMCGVIIRVDNCATNGVKKIARDPWVIEYGIYQIGEAVTFVLCVCMDARWVIASHGVAP
jgi:hypothetical protein